MGDFNIPGVKWLNDDIGINTEGKHSNQIVNEVADLIQISFNSLSLSSIINDCNSFGNYLDLVFTDLQAIEIKNCIDSLIEITVV